MWTIGRRTVAGLATGLVLVAGAAGCGGDDDSGEGDDGGQVTFVSWGGTSQEAQERAWLDPFVEANSTIEVRQDSPNAYAKIKSMVEAGNVTWDAVVVGGDFGLAPADTKLLEKIDCEVVECADLQPDELLTTGYRVPHTLLSINLGYNSDALDGQAPGSWDDFFDTDGFPGKRALWKWSGSGVIELALLADGVAPDELYPLDVERALEKLDSIKDDTIWFDDPAQCDQLLRDGEASMAQCPQTRILEAKKSGAPVDLSWDKALLTADWLVIPKGSKHVDEAMKLIAWITSAENNGAISGELPVGPTNVKAAAKVPADEAGDLPSDHVEESAFQDDEWYADHGADLDKRFQEWVQGR